MPRTNQAKVLDAWAEIEALREDRDGWKALNIKVQNLAEDIETQRYRLAAENAALRSAVEWQKLAIAERDRKLAAAEARSVALVAALEEAIRYVGCPVDDPNGLMLARLRAVLTAAESDICCQDCENRERMEED